MLWTDLARLFVGAAILGFASWTDWRWRRAPNALWLAMAALALAILGADAIADADRVRRAWPYLAAAPALAALHYGLYLAGLVPGGADAKALMALSALAPFPVALGTGIPPFASAFPASIVAFVDALVVFLLVPVGLLAVNVARGDFGAAMLFGVRRRLEDVDKGHYWLMDRVDDDGRLHRRWFASAGAYDIEEQKGRFRERGVARVWVTPKVPFMIPLAAGFVMAFTVGDVMTQALESILR